ncbi:hypothetical protein BGY98DRAFT_980017, partial [Russula aff. rugulosa BPL654]
MLWVAIGAPTPYWCWINPQYPGERPVANTSGCGLHYLLRQYYMSHCISGRRASFIGGTLIRGLNTHNGGQHWESFS